MLLFLDVISSLPEFLLIEDNKVLHKRKIIEKTSENLSDNIFESYIDICNDYNLNNNLKRISITIGPGSFTSLRVGAAFISGLKISKNLLYNGFSIDDIFKFKSSEYHNKEVGIFISSAKNQNFFCTYSKQNKVQYTKIENENFIIPKNFDIVLYNNINPSQLDNNIQHIKFTFPELFIDIYNKLNFTRNEIIRPLYISNNKILN